MILIELSGAQFHLLSSLSYKSDNKITSTITNRIGRHEVLLPMNHKNYNFWEKKSSQVMKERENLHLNTDKGDVNILTPSHLPPVIKRQKYKSKLTHK